MKLPVKLIYGNKNVKKRNTNASNMKYKRQMLVQNDIVL
jgi:hypothetical protein